MMLSVEHDVFSVLESLENYYLTVIVLIAVLIH